jgi:hypothetical protein
MAISPIGMVYVLLVEKGLYTIDRVPSTVREEVKQELLAREEAANQSAETQSTDTVE